MSFIYPIIFYGILIFIYLYSKGKLKRKQTEEYKKWVDTKGRKISKAVIILGLMYAVFYIVQMTS